jgi:hypothetical protein
MMHYATKLKAGTALLIPLAMAGCSDRDNNATATPPPGPPPAASIQSQIGANFASYYDAGNTSDPKDPLASDVPPLSLTTEPIAN